MKERFHGLTNNITPLQAALEAVDDIAGGKGVLPWTNQVTNNIILLCSFRGALTERREEEEGRGVLIMRC